MKKIRIRALARGVATLAMAGCVGASACRADVLFSEDFDGLPSDTNLTGLGWTRMAGSQDATVQVIAGLSNAPADRAVNGDSGANGINSWWRKGFDATPQEGTALLVLQFDGLADTSSRNSGCVFHDDATAKYLGWWAGWPDGYQGAAWGFDARALTGTNTSYENFAGGIGTAIVALAYIDLTNRQTWGCLVHSAGVYTTAVYDVANNIDLSGFDHVAIFQDRRNGYSGFDVDDILVTGLIPEPRPWAALAAIALALLASRRRPSTAG